MLHIKSNDSFDTLKMKEASVASELEFNHENASFTVNGSEENDSVNCSEMKLR